MDRAMITDPRFMTERARGEHKRELDAGFNAWIADKSMEQVFRELGPLGIPCSPAHSLEDIANDPYLRERGFLHDVEDPRAGTIPMIGPRIQFTGAQPQVSPYPSDLGEHNAEVLGGLLGYDEAKIEMLRKNKVI